MAMTQTQWSPLSEWTEKLDDVTQEGSNYRCACPKHEGHGFLFREDRSTNRVFFDCKAGCEYSEVAAELRKLGLRLWGDSQEYEYYSAAGKLAFIKVTYRRKSDGKKGRFYKCPSKTPGGPAFNHNSEKKNTRGPDGKCKRCGQGAPHLLYRLPELLAGIERGAEVWLCEGEKDANSVFDNHGSRNIVVTSTMNGVDDWDTEYRDIIVQASSVVIVADNDTKLATGLNPGFRGAWERYVSLSDFNVRVVRAAEGKDAFDHFANGHGIDDFVEVSAEELAKFANPESPSESLGEVVEFDYTQSAYAERFVALYGDRFRYVPGAEEGCWLYYDDGHWCVDRHDSALYFAYKLCRMVLRETPRYKEGEKKLNADYGTAKERCGAGNISSICRIARLIRPIETTWDKFDRDPFLLNTPSGTRDLRTGACRPHSPVDMITKMTAYDLQDKGPVFDEYFKKVQPSEHWREQILRNLGCALSGRYGQHLFVHSGSGGNGKTTLLELAERSLGPDYAVEASWKILNAAGEDAHETILAELDGKRLSYVQLGNRGLSAEQLRIIVAEPNLKARKMRQDSHTIRATHTLHVAQNDPPVMKKLDASVRRRIVHVPWNVTIPADEREDDLSLRLEPGYLLKLMIEAYQRFDRHEIDLTATTDYFRANMLYAFIEDVFTADPDGFVTAAEANDLYVAWAERNPGARKKVTADAIGGAMTDFGFGKGMKSVKREGKRSSVRGRTGFRARTDSDSA